MGLIVAGVIPVAFVALVTMASFGCPALLGQPAFVLFAGSLTLFGVATAIFGARSRAGAAGSRIAGQLPAGLAAGALVQPSTAFLFAIAIALAAVAGGPTRVPERLYASALFVAGALAAYVLVPLTFGPPVTCP